MTHGSFACMLFVLSHYPTLTTFHLSELLPSHNEQQLKMYTCESTTHIMLAEGNSAGSYFWVSAYHALPYLAQDSSNCFATSISMPQSQAECLRPNEQ